MIIRGISQLFRNWAKRSDTADATTPSALTKQLKATEPGSDERAALLEHGNRNGLLKVPHFGANVTIIAPKDDSAQGSPLDTIKVALLERYMMDEHENAKFNEDGSAERDGIGAMGGRGDAGETPITGLLREVLEEMLDVDILEIPAGQTRKDFIHGKIDDFIKAHPDVPLRDTENGITPQKVRSALDMLKERGAVFELSDDLVLDLTKLDLVPFDEAVDLSFPNRLAENDPRFDTLECTKPFMFIYQTDSMEEFEKFLTPAPLEQSEERNREARSISAFSLRDVLEHNHGDKAPKYNPEKSPRYLHEGFVAAYIAAKHGVPADEALAIQPESSKIAKLMGVSESMLATWLQRGHDGKKPAAANSNDVGSAPAARPR